MNTEWYTVLLYWFLIWFTFCLKICQLYNFEQLYCNIINGHKLHQIGTHYEFWTRYLFYGKIKQLWNHSIISDIQGPYKNSHRNRRWSGYEQAAFLKTPSYSYIYSVEKLYNGFSRRAYRLDRNTTRRIQLPANSC